MCPAAPEVSSVSHQSCDESTHVPPLLFTQNTSGGSLPALAKATLLCFVQDKHSYTEVIADLRKFDNFSINIHSSIRSSVVLPAAVLHLCICNSELHLLTPFPLCSVSMHCHQSTKPGDIYLYIKILL